MTAHFAALKINHRTSPLGVAAKPRYSFAVESDGRSALLDACTITLRDPAGKLVYENRAERDGSLPLMTSGILDAPLEPFTRYTWPIQGVCSSDGATFAAEKSSAWFETGYIGEPFKHAQWLTLGKAHALGRSADFRLEIGFVPCENESAHLYAANATVGIIFGASDEENYYLLKIYTQIGESRMMAAIFECRDGATSRLAEKDITHWLAPAAFIGSEHTAVLTAGKPMTILLDGHPIFSERIDIRAGGFGFSQPYPTGTRYTHVALDSSDEHIREDFSDPGNMILTGGYFGNGYSIKARDAFSRWISRPRRCSGVI